MSFTEQPKDRSYYVFKYGDREGRIPLNKEPMTGEEALAITKEDGGFFVMGRYPAKDGSNVSVGHCPLHPPPAS